MKKIYLFAFVLLCTQHIVGQSVKENHGVIKQGSVSFTLLGDMVKIGDIAPNFTAINNKGESVALSDFKGKTVILSVFPSVDTKVCATQTRQFNKESSDLSKNIVVLTLSKDLPFALDRFCAAEGIDRIHTLSDYKYSDFGYKYGFLLKENMLLARGVVVIDANGKVVYVEYVKDISKEPNYKNALNAAKATL